MSPIEAIAALSRLAEVLADLPEELEILAATCSPLSSEPLAIHAGSPRHDWWREGAAIEANLGAYYLTRRVRGVRVFTLAAPEHLPAWALRQIADKHNAAIDAALAALDAR